MRSARAPLILAAALAILAGGARPAQAADVMLPPTLVLDFLYLGFPTAIVAGPALVAAVVIVYRRLRRRGRGRAFSAAMGALVLFAGNLACYLIWVSFLRVPAWKRDMGLETPSAAPAQASSSEPPASHR